MFAIELKQRKTQLTLNLQGALTIYHVSEAQSQLQKVDNFQQKIVCNLSELSELDTAGLQILLSLMKTVHNQGGELLISKSSEVFNDLATTFDLTQNFTMSKS